jgi:serpin B
MRAMYYRASVVLFRLVGFGLAAGALLGGLGLVWERIALAKQDAQLGGIDQRLVEANNQFAFDLYAQLGKDARDGNVFFSPLSVSVIMAQTYAGAGANTAREMKDVLHFELEPSQLHSAVGSLLKNLASPGGKTRYQLSIANALWVDQSYGLLSDFVAIGKEYYGAAPMSVDFQHAAEAQCKAINGWVDEHTHGKITDAVPPATLNAETRLVLTNAVYFKAGWAGPFDRSLTQDGRFGIVGGKSVQTPLMNLTDDFRYMETSNFQMLEMTYKGNDLGMLILLPREVDGLANLENTLNARTLCAWIGKLDDRPREVNITLPRFAMTSSFRLASALQSLGMRDAFSSKAANFSGISSSPLFIHDVWHDASVDVNEEGTEAAAATRIAKYPGKGGLPKPVIFRADHPFIFLIRDIHSGSILFLGRVMNPKA